MFKSKESDQSFYKGLAFDKQAIDLQFSGTELYYLIKVLGLSGEVFKLAEQNCVQVNDASAAKTYAENSQLALAFRNKLLNFAKIGHPPDPSKH